MKILITGATGLIGKELGLELVRRGHQVVVISRDKHKAELNLPFPCDVIEGDLTKEPIQNPKLKDVQGVVHLSGEGVAERRWSGSQKTRILESRTLSTRNLIASLSPVQVFVSASGIGFYGDRQDQELREDDAPGMGFLTDVVLAWEAEADRAEHILKARVVKLRTGVVLASQGGALVKMRPAFQAGFAGPLGGGGQWMSWIHLQDIVNLYVYALETPHLSGAVNAVAPNPETNRVFSQTMAFILNRRLLPSVPSLFLRIGLGQMANAVLASQKVVPEKAIQNGFVFQFRKLDEALIDLLKSQNRGEEYFETKQYLAQAPEEVFKFFSEARNLERITPRFLRFRMTNMNTSSIKEGTLIDYKIKIHGFPAGWRTQIEQWRPPTHFVDSSLKGPYRMWQHTHQFEKLGSGTLMTDRIRYQLPLGYMGWLVASRWVRKDVENIFAYRRKVTAEIFETGSKPNP